MITREQRNIHINNWSFLGIVVLTLTIAATGFLSLWTVFRADDSAPMTIWNINVISQSMKSSQPFVYEFEYNKRKECHPPKGQGEVAYRTWFQDPATSAYNRFVWIEPSTVSYADPDQHFRRNSIDMPKLNPGHYLMQYRARFVCEGASKTLEFDGPLMPFEIVH